MFICLCWQQVSLIVVCLLETDAGDVNLSSAELLQLFSILHGLCWCVTLSVCAVRRSSRMSPSANRSLCLAHNERITWAGPAVSAPVFVCVLMKKCVCMSVLESVRSVSSHLYSTPSTHSIAAVPQKPSLYIIVSSFFSAAFSTLSFTLSTGPSFFHCITLLYPSIFQSSSMSFTCPLSSCHLLPTSSPLLFSCHPCSPPSLTPQLGSTMRWQWQGCGVCVCIVCVLMFVCVMSHSTAL